MSVFFKAFIASVIRNIEIPVGADYYGPHGPCFSRCSSFYKNVKSFSYLDLALLALLGLGKS